MKAPKVSVILPVYNGERYIERSIQSVLDQTFPDIECVVLNDGSTDGTEAILLGLRHPRLRVIHQENRGIVRSLNRLIREARGALLARLDSDDWCKPTRIERQVAFLEAHPEVVALGSACQLVDENGMHLGHQRVPVGAAAIRRAMAWRNPLVHSSMMFRRIFMERVGGYDEHLHPSDPEDYDLWLRLQTLGPLENIDEVLVVRTERRGSLSKMPRSLHHASMFRVKWAATRRGGAPRTLYLGMCESAGKWTVSKLMEASRMWPGFAK